MSKNKENNIMSSPPEQAISYSTHLQTKGIHFAFTTDASPWTITEWTSKWSKVLPKLYHTTSSYLYLTAHMKSTTAYGSPISPDNLG